MSYDFQKKVREESNRMQKTVSDLNDFFQTIKTQDDQIAEDNSRCKTDGRIFGTRNVPIRGTKGKMQVQPPKQKSNQKIFDEDDDDDDDEQKFHALKEKGNLKFRSKKFKESLEWYKKAARVKPSPVIFSNISACYRKLGDLNLALRYATESIDMDYGYIKGYYRRGVLRRDMKLFREALDDFQRGLTLKPQSKLFKDEVKKTKSIFQTSLKTKPKKKVTFLVESDEDDDVEDEKSKTVVEEEVPVKKVEKIKPKEDVKPKKEEVKVQPKKEEVVLRPKVEEKKEEEEEIEEFVTPGIEEYRREKKMKERSVFHQKPKWVMDRERIEREKEIEEIKKRKEGQRKLVEKQKEEKKQKFAKVKTKDEKEDLPKEKRKFTYEMPKAFPKTFSEFEINLKQMGDSQKYEYMEMIMLQNRKNTKYFKNLFNLYLDNDIATCMIKAITQRFLKSGKQEIILLSYDILRFIRKIERWETIIQFLEKDLHDEIKFVFQELEKYISDEKKLGRLAKHKKKYFELINS